MFIRFIYVHILFLDYDNGKLAWTNTPREAGGLGKMNIPLLADRTQQISASYGVLKVIRNINYFFNPICLMKFVMTTVHATINLCFQL